MSAVETLRKAAEELRVRADDAILATGDAPWHFTGMNYCIDRNASTYSVWSSSAPHAPDPDAVFVCDAATEEQALHIAAMGPGVGLALADWLEAAIVRTNIFGDLVDDGMTTHALAVARAVVGEAS